MAALGGAVVLQMVAGPWGPHPLAAPSSAPLHPAPPSPAAGSGLPAPLAAAEAAFAASGPRSVAQLHAALYQRGSLRGAQPDGGWALDAAGQLRPDIAVRRRFDHLLSAMGEASLAELGLLLQAQARRELPAPAVAQALRLWQHYLALQSQAYAHNADLRDASTWAPALDERVRLRQELLGPAWAEAFYGEEEAQLRRHIAAQQEAQPSAAAAELSLPDAARPPAPGEDTQAVFQRRQATLGFEAAQRLQQLDEEEARWAQRIAQAGAHLQRLAQAPELSAPQREEAITRYLDTRFSPEERLRARALLGLNRTP